MSWIALALQTRKIDDNALKNAAKGNRVADLRPELLRTAPQHADANHARERQPLGLAWSFEFGEGGGKQEGTPLFANGIIYASDQLEHHRSPSTRAPERKSGAMTRRPTAP